MTFLDEIINAALGSAKSEQEVQENLAETEKQVQALTVAMWGLLAGCVILIGLLFYNKR